MFLFGVLALPACGPEPSDDPTVPDGGNPDNFASACKDLYTRLGACYGESLPPQYASEVAEYCAEYAGIIEEQFGTDCVGAMEEMYACMASLDCATLLSAEGLGLAADCEDVALEAYDLCPELIWLCSNTSSSGGGSTGSSGEVDLCELSASECLDGQTYAVSCESTPVPDGETPKPLSCTCQRGGMDVMSVEIAGVCWSDEFYKVAAEACDFPDGVFRG